MQVELGVERYRSIMSLGKAATSVQAGNKVGLSSTHGWALLPLQASYTTCTCEGACPCAAQPCFVFAGEQFENDADFRLAKSMLLDMFRGRLVDNINLKARASPDTLALMPAGPCHCSLLEEQP